MSNRLLPLIAAGVLLGPIAAGCIDEVVTPPAGGVAAVNDEASVTVWADAAEPVLVITGAVAIREFFDALPPAAREALVSGGTYESHDPEIVRSHREALSGLAPVKDRPDFHIPNVSWARIKERYRT